VSGDSPFGGFTAENVVDLLMQAIKLDTEHIDKFLLC